MKACIHPSQVPVVRGAFRPEPREVEWARRLMLAAETAGAGVFSFEGQIIDAPVPAQHGSLAGDRVGSPAAPDSHSRHRGRARTYTGPTRSTVAAAPSELTPRRHRSRQP